MGKARPLTDFEKSLRNEIFERDKHIENSVKNDILNGRDVQVSANDPEWRKQAIANYKKEHTYSVKDDSVN